MAQVGVIIPVRGFAPFLAEALDAVLAEGPARVVVVDDASPEPVALHPDHAPHAELLRLPAPAGPGAARNAGAAALAGVAALAFCDADDAWLPGSLARRVAALAAGAAWVCGAAEVVGLDGRPTGERWPPGPPSYEHNPVCTSSVLVRADAFPGFGPGLAEDWDLWLRLLAAGHAPVVLDRPVVRYRRHPGALTADVAALARAQLALHERHAAAAGPAAARRALAADHAALASTGPRRRALAHWWQAARRGRPSPRPLLARRGAAPYAVR